MAERWGDLKAFVADWHRPIQAGDGCTEEEIAAAETQLGFRLPEALRELYSLIGKWEEITRAHNRLVLLKELEVEDGYMVVWEENQCVVLYAVAEESLSDENPPIIWLQDGQPVTSEDNDSLEETALLMLAYETVLAGDYVGVGFLNEETIDIGKEVDRLKAETIETPFQVLNEFDFRYWGDALLCFAGGNEIWMATRNSSSLAAIVEKYDQIIWSYTSLEDE